MWIRRAMFLLALVLVAAPVLARFLDRRRVEAPRTQQVIAYVHGAAVVLYGALGFVWLVSLLA